MGWRGLGERHPIHAPPARYAHGLAFDPGSQKVVLFGGEDAAASLSDTWEWDGVDWLQRAPLTSPGARGFVDLVFDAASSRVILVGGARGTTFYSETWAWQGATWAPLAVSSPPQRWASAVAGDTARQRVVLFGGYDNGDLDDLWEWDGTSWTQRPTAVAPRPRSSTQWPSTRCDSARCSSADKAARTSRPRPGNGTEPPGSSASLTFLPRLLPVTPWRGTTRGSGSSC